jgi:hypothetical protein
MIHEVSTKEGLITEIISSRRQSGEEGKERRALKRDARVLPERTGRKG